ncbi:MAG: hypothetical protein GY757_58470, partial [bacterium]|nr:hypothetical protein [bacterium]
FKDQKNYVAPRGKIEETLAEIWAEILGLEKNTVSTQANFFEMGGHSLKATQLVSLIHKKFNKKIPLNETFKIPTIKGLAALLKKTGKTRFLDLENEEKKENYPLSYNQARLMVLCELEPESPAYNMPGEIHLKQDVDENLIEKVIMQLIRRHDSLRTGFKYVGKQPVQYIITEVKNPFKTIDLSSLREEEKQKERDRYISEVTTAPFKLDEIPLFRAVLIKLENNVYHLLFNMHHIITDGWSQEIIKREFYHYYEKYANQNNYQPQPLQYQYKDFAAWNNKQITEADTRKKLHDYWKEKVQRGVPTVRLPADNAQNTGSKKGAAYLCQLDNETKRKLKETAENNNTSLFVVMFSAYLIMLARYSKETEIASSIIAAGREHISLREIVGFFVNSLIFKIHVDAEERFDKFVETVHSRVMESFQNQGYPVEQVFHELNMAYPEIPVSFNMLNIGEASTEGQPEYTGPQHTTHVQDVKFDIEPYIRETKNGIHMDWRYKKEMFKPETIENIVGDYMKLIRFFIEKPQKKIKEFSRKTKKRSFKRK